MSKTWKEKGIGSQEVVDLELTLPTTASDIAGSPSSLGEPLLSYIIQLCNGQNISMIHNTMRA